MSGSAPTRRVAGPAVGAVGTVCVVGSGGREHALAVVLGRTADVVVTPGNPGIGGHDGRGPHLDQRGHAAPRRSTPTCS